ncbi:unnamed protein product [Paramecium sonneborni]|uniref:Uncharacterized protein n=1 Tax=Paramecium sonneborni TaxID=65129 RepID=A0A8S1PVE9_9CILI|nr:unnamed protein product [Paramecium sonneborni]
MLTTFNSSNSIFKKDRYRLISFLLLKHLKTHHKDIFMQNLNIRILLKKKNHHQLRNLKNDFEAKQLTLEYFGSFQLISDILELQIDANCLVDIQELCYYLSN